MKFAFMSPFLFRIVIAYFTFSTNLSFDFTSTTISSFLTTAFASLRRDYGKSAKGYFISLANVTAVKPILRRSIQAIMRYFDVIVYKNYYGEYRLKSKEYQAIGSIPF